MRRLRNNVNLYEPQNTLYALKFPVIIVMEAQNKRVLLKIILHCHGQPVCFVFVSLNFNLHYSQNSLDEVLHDKFKVRVKIYLKRNTAELTINTIMKETFLPPALKAVLKDLCCFPLWWCDLQHHASNVCALGKKVSLRTTIN